ncbi:MBL fold metallo-hydrolase [Lampropedia puyangensis]|uniref:MBL fold metallo-hydrolase n=1 Tax=Lampropedia puyangensis TaxID=1330072 RepID=A0A4S8F9K4_9BURK|nr:MBL fold metallo-hydrolase [Lampropedia puyangensis]THU04150.1 MBL fold metallo-hydrolase [Lampropedia puyangensis]
MAFHSLFRIPALISAAGLALSASMVAPSAGIAATAAEKAPLQIEIFNPGHDAIFAVSSVLVTGQSEAILIDAQFSAADARKLVNQVKASGKPLSTIYISHGDPDFYFGLDTLKAAFPNAKILATPQTIAHIEQTKDEKLKVWGPQLGENAPKTLITPQALQGDTLNLEGHELKIMGLTGPTPDRSYVWIPSIQTVAGGIPVLAGEHVWMADTQTPQSHTDWLATLETIKALHPKVVVPGHFAPGSKLDISAVTFTGDYIRAFDEETAKANNSQDLVEAMKKRYPTLGGESGLELSAKVAKGEMQWK